MRGNAHPGSTKRDYDNRPAAGGVYDPGRPPLASATPDGWYSCSNCGKSHRAPGEGVVTTPCGARVKVMVIHEQDTTCPCCGRPLAQRDEWTEPKPLKHWARVFHLSERSVQSWFSKGTVRAKKRGKHWAVLASELRETEETGRCRKRGR